MSCQEVPDTSPSFPELGAGQEKVTIRLSSQRTFNSVSNLI
jgi:hypothetical protein